MPDSRKNKKQDMETSRAGSPYKRWKEARGERKGLCGLEVVMVSRVGGTDNGCRDKGKDLGKGRGWVSRKRCPSWREASKEVEM